MATMTTSVYHRLLPKVVPANDDLDPERVGGPVWGAWREGTLTRAKELESLRDWLSQHPDTIPTSHDPAAARLSNAMAQHLAAAREAATAPRPLLRPAKAALVERAMSNLDAAEADLLQLAPEDYLVGQVPRLLNHVQRHLRPDDPRRHEVERIAKKLGVKDPDHPLLPNNGQQTLDQQKDAIRHERGSLISSVRAASSAALREQLRVRSFGVVLLSTTVVMTVLAIAIATVGFFFPSTIPLCFQPERSGQAIVVCPTAQSALLPTEGAAGPAQPDIDDVVKTTAGPADLLVVELVGLLAAAIAAASAIRGIRGSSEPYAIPVTLAALKLPTGAVTAFLGLMLMRGQFVPGLSALDTSAQILAWALVFGYAQQLFTRLVDQQAHTVLDGVRGADRQPSPA
jgi:hypothetical protein